MSKPRQKDDDAVSTQVNISRCKYCGAPSRVTTCDTCKDWRYQIDFMRRELIPRIIGMFPVKYHSGPIGEM